MPNGDKVQVIRVSDGKVGSIPKAQLGKARASGKFKLTTEVPTQFEKDRTPEGSALGRGIKAFAGDLSGMAGGMAKLASQGLGVMEGNPEAIKGLYKDTKSRLESVKQSDTERKAEGRSGAYRALAGGVQATGAIDPTGMEEAGRKGDTAGVVGHAAAQATPYVVGGARSEVGEASKAAGRKVGAKIDAGRIEKATQEIKGTLTGAKTNFGPRLEHTIKQGYLPEIERQYKPKTMREAASAVLETADQIQKKVVNDAIDRHPKDVISGDAIAHAVYHTLKDADLIYGGLGDVIREARKYEGINIPLSAARDLLTRLNAIDRSMRNAAPETAHAAMTMNSTKRAVRTAADNVREQLYTKLHSVGEYGIDQFQEDYGALRTVGETMEKNIVRAEKIGKGPGLMESMIRNHPWLSLASMGLVGMGEEFGHGGIATGAAAIPFIRWALERRGVPNATIERAMSRLGKVSKKPPTPVPYEPMPGKGRTIPKEGKGRAPMNRQLGIGQGVQALPDSPPIKGLLKE